MLGHLATLDLYDHRHLGAMAATLLQPHQPRGAPSALWYVTLCVISMTWISQMALNMMKPSFSDWCGPIQPRQERGKRERFLTAEN